MHRLLVLFCFLLGSPVVRAEYLHVVFAHEMEDPDIANQCKGAVAATLGAIANGLPNELTRLHELSREDLKSTPAFVEKMRLLSQEIGADDAVMFYYSGHGVLNRGKQYIRFKDDCFVERESALKAVEATGAKFVLFITDMCANHGEVKVSNLGSGCASCGAAEKSADRISPVIDRLFFEAAGVVEFSSCSPNEQAISNRSDPFTVFGGALAYALHGALSQKSPTWNSIAALTTRKVRENAEHLLQEHGKKQFLDASHQIVTQSTQTVLVKNRLTNDKSSLHGDTEIVTAHEAYLCPHNGFVKYVTIKRRVNHATGTETLLSVFDHGLLYARRNGDMWAVPNDNSRLQNAEGLEFNVRIRSMLGVSPESCPSHHPGVHAGKIYPSSPATNMYDPDANVRRSLEPGDHIMSVNGVTVSTPDEAISQLLGSPDEVFIVVQDQNDPKKQYRLTAKLGYGRGYK